MPPAKLSLTDYIAHLVREKHFLAFILNACQKIEVPGLGTAGVGIVDGRVCLYYDPQFFASITYWNALFTIDHEGIHLLMDHIPRYLEFLARFPTPEMRAKADAVFQLAVDAAANGSLRKDPNWWRVEHEDPPWVLPEKLTAQLGIPLRLDESLEYYLGTLMGGVKTVHIQILADMPGNFRGGSHKFWVPIEGEGKDKEAGNSTLTTEELQGLAHQVRAQLKETLRRVEKEFKKSRGTMPGHFAEWLKVYLADPMIPWWSILRDLIASARANKMRRSTQRPNRSLLALAEEDDDIEPAIGRIRDPQFHGIFYIDTSGSMGTEELRILNAEGEHLLNTEEVNDLRYMQGDTATTFDQVFTAGDSLPRKMLGRGGTDFNQYFRDMSKYVGDEETHPDFVVVATDGGCSPVDALLRLPDDVVPIWLLTTGPGSWAWETIVQAGYGIPLFANPAHRSLWKE